MKESEDNNGMIQYRCDHIDSNPPSEIFPPYHPKPLAPRLRSRGSSFVTLEILPFFPTKRFVKYYIVYGKATGAGTDVSLNNMGLPGTGAIIYPPIKASPLMVRPIRQREFFVYLHHLRPPSRVSFQMKATFLLSQLMTPKMQ
jgi:hypothetical protein